MNKYKLAGQVHHARNGAEAALVYSTLKEFKVRIKMHVYAYTLMGNIFYFFCLISKIALAMLMHRTARTHWDFQTFVWE